MHVSLIASRPCSERGSSVPLHGGGDLLVRLIERIGTNAFASAVLSQLSRVAPAGAVCAYQVRRREPPTLLLGATQGRAEVTNECWRTYRDGLYLEDSSFEPARQLVRGGDKLALSHLHADELPVAHRSRIYQQHAIQERLSVIAADRDDAIMTVNLYRFRGESPFSAAESDSLAVEASAVVACIRRHHELCKAAVPAVSPDEHIDGLLRMKCAELTSREVQVCRGIFRGWTFDGIAAELDISPTTVKTYRDRAFQRLGIHHRNELFNLCTSTSTSTSARG